MDPEAHLLEVLYSHESQLGPDDVSWAFEHAKTAGPVTEYINKYLRDDRTLLSVEEATLHAHLAKTGVLPKLLKHVSNPTTGSGGYRSEHQLRAETDELNAATSLLRQQAAHLRKQQQMLDTGRSRKRAEKERRKKSEAQRRRKWIAEREEMRAALDDLVGIMKEEVADLHETVVPRNEEVGEVETVLAGDDRVLARLERLAGELVLAEGEEHGAEVVARVEALVEKLSYLTTATIRTRLDRVFLEYSRVEEGEDVEMEDPQPLQSEIDSLYTDIPTVARGAAYNEFLQPLLTAITAVRRDRNENWAVGADYICAVLSHLRSRAGAMTSLLSSSNDRDAAVLTLIATITRESAAAGSDPAPRPSTPPPKQPLPPRRLGSPVKFADPSSKVGRISFLTPTARRRGKSIDLLTHSKDEYPELALLSHLGLLLPPPTASGVPLISEKFLGTQVAAAAGRVDGVGALEMGTWEGARDETATSARVLMEALWEGNEFGGDAAEGAMSVVRSAVRERSREVEMRVKEVAGVMGRLVGKVDGIERFSGDVGGEGRKGEFVSRWRR